MSAVIDFAVDPGYEHPAAVLLDQRRSTRMNAPSAKCAMRSTLFAGVKRSGKVFENTKAGVVQGEKMSRESTAKKAR